MLVSWLRDRGNKGCAPFRIGAKGILRNPIFSKYSRCQWAHQLDRGSLCAWVLVCREIVPAQCRAVPGWAADLDASCPRQPSGHPRWVLSPDALVNLVLSVTLCACTKTLKALGWVPRVACVDRYSNKTTESTLLHKCKPLAIRWAYGRALKWKATW